MDLKTKPQAAKIIFFVVLGVLALILAVIGDNTVNIPEIFRCSHFLSLIRLRVIFKTL